MSDARETIEAFFSFGEETQERAQARQGVLSRVKELEEIGEERLRALLQAETENTTLRTQLAHSSRLLVESEALLKDLKSALKRSYTSRRRAAERRRGAALRRRKPRP